MSSAVINYFLAWSYVGPQGRSRYRSEILKLTIQEQHEFWYLFKKKKKRSDLANNPAFLDFLL